MLFMDFLQGHFLCEPKTAEDARIEFLKTDVVADMPDPCTQFHMGVEEYEKITKDP